MEPGGESEGGYGDTIRVVPWTVVGGQREVTKQIQATSYPDDLVLHTLVYALAVAHAK